MRRYPFVTIDVFTDRRFGGNPLAVFPDAAGLSDDEMQALAAELNLSETTFVLPPSHPANSARVRIFNRAAEMPFAGHPNVGTGFALAQMGRAVGEVLRFEELAGLVEVRLMRHGGVVVGAEIDAPQPLQLFDEVPPELLAPCIGLSPNDICAEVHAPVRASVGVDFILAELAPGSLSRATPDASAFRRALAAHPGTEGRFSLFVYERHGGGVRARMFSPLTGTWEDPATGSANAALAALLLDVRGGDTLAYEAVQGVEMGRTSHLALSARRTADGIRATVGGRCVPVFTGEASL
jgi:trans-2,3-dihydro-3-hydroxyanthranilate isomerase